MCFCQLFPKLIFFLLPFYAQVWVIIFHMLLKFKRNRLRLFFFRNYIFYKQLYGLFFLFLQKTHWHFFWLMATNVYCLGSNKLLLSHRKVRVKYLKIWQKKCSRSTSDLFRSTCLRFYCTYTFHRRPSFQKPRFWTKKCILKKLTIKICIYY